MAITSVPTNIPISFGPKGNTLVLERTILYTDEAGDTGNAFAMDSFDTYGGEEGVGPPLRTRISIRRTDANGTDLDAFVLIGADTDFAASAGDVPVANENQDQAAFSSGGTLSAANSGTQNFEVGTIYGHGHSRFLALSVDSVAVIVNLTIKITMWYA